MQIIINHYHAEDIMAKQQITALIAAVAAQTTVTSSAITLIQGLSEQLKDATVKLAEAGADTAELVDITNQITTESSALAAAIEQNATITATGIAPQETLAVSEIGTDSAATESSSDASSGGDTTAVTENVTE